MIPCSRPMARHRTTRQQTSWSSSTKTSVALPMGSRPIAPSTRLRLERTDRMRNRFFNRGRRPSPPRRAAYTSPSFGRARPNVAHVFGPADCGHLSRSERYLGWRRRYAPATAPCHSPTPRRNRHAIDAGHTSALAPRAWKTTLGAPVKTDWLRIFVAGTWQGFGRTQPKFREISRNIGLGTLDQLLCYQLLNSLTFFSTYPHLIFEEWVDCSGCWANCNQVNDFLAS